MNVYWHGSAPLPWPTHLSENKQYGIKTTQFCCFLGVITRYSSFPTAASVYTVISASLTVLPNKRVSDLKPIQIREVLFPQVIAAFHSKILSTNPSPRRPHHLQLPPPPTYLLVRVLKIKLNLFVLKKLIFFSNTLLYYCMRIRAKMKLHRIRSKRLLH